MRRYIQSLFVIIISLTFFIKCGEDKKDEAHDMMQEKIDQFVKTELKYDESLLDENQKIVVRKLFEAGKIMDELFLEQVYSKNNEIKSVLQNSTDPNDKLTLEYFNIMFGPFDRLDHDKPFYGTESKPLGANFYPADMTKEEFAEWIKNHPEDEAAFTSEFTVIRRDGDKLVAVPYSEFYKDKLEKASTLLKEAAAHADNPSLKKYLESRADAFASNDYYQSDMDWMDLKDHDIEVIVGPYEVYEDAMFNYKASFEMFLTILDPVESVKLKQFASYLNDMEKNLPIPDEHKNFNRGSESPIAVVNQIFSAGDTKAGVQTLAFNLPNDERVRAAKGSKKVMIKNMHEAKFEKLLKPISEIVVDPEQLKYVTFDGFFNHTLMHEMSHGIGPGFIKVNGRDTEVKKELKETYSKIEECKADILGMLENILMIQKGVYEKSFENELWVTFLGGVFRSVRFGINEAHGGGTAIIYNFMIENGGYEYNEGTQKLKVNFDKVYNVLEDLAHKLLMIQATGDYEGAKKLIADYAVQSPSMTILVEKLKTLPVDINPVFQIETHKD
ncbi:MAG: peptidase [Bacteroidetes bacterium]|nr:peptidase [Bacteroidota bacterium]